jgi:hypothetical protein
MLVSLGYVDASLSLSKTARSRSIESRAAYAALGDFGLSVGLPPTDARACALGEGDEARPSYDGLGEAKGTDTRFRSTESRPSYDGLGRESFGLVGCAARISLRSEDTDSRPLAS